MVSSFSRQRGSALLPPTGNVAADGRRCPPFRSYRVSSSNLPRGLPAGVFSLEGDDVSGTETANGKLFTLDDWQSFWINDIHPIARAIDRYNVMFVVLIPLLFVGWFAANVFFRRMADALFLLPDFVYLVVFLASMWLVLSVYWNFVFRTRKGQWIRLQQACRTLQDRWLSSDSLRYHNSFHWTMECEYQRSESVLSTPYSYGFVIYFIPIRLDDQNSRLQSFGFCPAWDELEDSTLDEEHLDDMLTRKGYVRVKLYEGYTWGYHWTPISLSHIAYAQSQMVQRFHMPPEDSEKWTNFWSQLLVLSQHHLRIHRLSLVSSVAVLFYIVLRHSIWYDALADFMGRAYVFMELFLMIMYLTTMVQRGWSLSACRDWVELYQHEFHQTPLSSTGNRGIFMEYRRIYPFTFPTNHKLQCCDTFRGLECFHYLYLFPLPPLIVGKVSSPAEP